MNQLLINPWIWTRKAMEMSLNFVEGESVPLEFMTIAEKEYIPNQEWIEKGYVDRQSIVMFTSELV
ncbi:hypothetical protein LCM23_12835 [Cytobacillus kochii]|uniref:hypothetical protein n=1 Tax=Cytobacillus kochii TaxID=859143 RepID=UPI001CD5E067|nr:hypothetical protein [Cytobacillus kochii]MCA1026979.1 hypothetical protein [Cytobacillus kochii]